MEHSNGGQKQREQEIKTVTQMDVKLKWAQSKLIETYCCSSQLVQTYQLKPT